MKGAFIGSGIGIVILLLLYTRLAIYSSKGSIDFHLHDTYFVLSYTTVVLFVLLFLGTFFSIGGLVGTRFRSKLFWVVTVIFLAIDTYYLVTFYNLFHDMETVAQPLG